jgi:hypothetical protein
MYGTLLLASLVGCSLFDQGRDVFEGLTNPLVAEAIVLGVEAPEFDGVDLEAVGLAEGTGGTIFLADAAGVQDLANAPIDGADVRVRAAGAGDGIATGAGAGLYVLAPGQISYAAGASWQLLVDDGDGGALGTATLALPPTAELSLPTEHTAGSPLTVDLTGRGFNSVLVVVIAGDSQQTTYSNEPKDIRAIYDFTHGDDEVTTHEIPGSAFPAAGVYAVGVAGMLNASMDDFDQMNTALSAMVGGQMRFYPVRAM